MSLKSHFTFKRQQRNGILLFTALILFLLFIRLFVNFSSEDRLDISSEELTVITKELDSLRKTEGKSLIRPFNPNYITDDFGVFLGMSDEEIDRLLEFRDQGRWINSPLEFQKVTGISDSLLKDISPYFKFPEWVNQKEKNASQKTWRRIDDPPKTFEEKRDLNTATTDELMEIRGIGETLSERIVTYRSRIEGFTVDEQLHQVFGLDSVVVQRILLEFTVKTPRIIQKININQSSASDIATLPGISFELAKEIWEYRRLRERLYSIEELTNIEGISASKLQLIQLYLSLD